MHFRSSERALITVKSSSSETKGCQDKSWQLHYSTVSLEATLSYFVVSSRLFSCSWEHSSRKSCWEVLFFSSQQTLSCNFLYGLEDFLSHFDIVENVSHRQRVSHRKRESFLLRKPRERHVLSTTKSQCETLSCTRWSCCVQCCQDWYLLLYHFSLYNVIPAVKGMSWEDTYSTRFRHFFLLKIDMIFLCLKEFFDFFHLRTCFLFWYPLAIFIRSYFLTRMRSLVFFTSLWTGLLVLVSREKQNSSKENNEKRTSSLSLSILLFSLISWTL